MSPPTPRRRRSHQPAMTTYFAARWRLGLAAPAVQRLLRRWEALREVDAVDIAKDVADPAVDLLLRGAEPAEGGLQVVGLQVNNCHVAGGSLLNPYGLSVYAMPLARGIMRRLPLTIGDRLHGAAVGFGLTREYRCSEGYALHVVPSRGRALVARGSESRAPAPEAATRVPVRDRPDIIALVGHGCGLARECHGGSPEG